MAENEIYDQKENGYFRYTRYDLIESVSFGENKVLDVGCGEGATGYALKKMGKAQHVVGIELHREAAEIARHRIDQVILGDVEHLNLTFPEGYFDYFIMGDIIEHLVDPWKTLKSLQRFLSTKGYLIASIPNAAHWRILKDLILFDEWEYQKAGLLDKGHLRFFTKKTILRMFKEGGFKVNSISAKTSPTKRSRFLHTFTPNMFGRFLTRQYLVKAQRTS